MIWTHNYDPLHNPALSTLVAAVPIVVLLGTIALLKLRIHFAALLGLAVALGISIFTFSMPAKLAGTTAL